MTRRSFFALCAGLITLKPESALQRDLATVRAKFIYSSGIRYVPPLPLLLPGNRVWFTPVHDRVMDKYISFANDPLINRAELLKQLTFSRYVKIRPKGDFP